MTPIISPWVFYLMGISTPIKVTTAMIAGTFGVMWVVFNIMSKVELCDYGDNPDYQKMKTLGKSCLPVFLISMVIFLAVPTESTLTKMIVAQNVTYERVEMVGDTVKDVYEDIISLVDGNNEDTEDTEE